MTHARRAMAVLLLLCGAAAGQNAIDPLARARQQIEASAQSQDPFLRANAMEALAALVEPDVDLLRRGMSDEHPAVRFAALAVVGKLKLTDLRNDCRPCLKDADASVRAAALFALARCGDSVNLTPLASLLASPQPGTRANVAMLLGMMQDRSAVAMLKDLAATPLPRAAAVQIAILRLQVAEALVQLGDEASLDAIRSGLYSPFDEVRVLAVTMMGKLKDRRMDSALVELLSKPPVELQVSAAGALARMGQPQALGVVTAAAAHQLTAVRAQVAATLALFDDDAARATLLRLLDDPQEQVRLAAAAALAGANRR